MKKVIRLTESEFKNLIKTTAMKVLRESIEAGSLFAELMPLMDEIKDMATNRVPKGEIEMKLDELFVAAQGKMNDPRIVHCNERQVDIAEDAPQFKGVFKSFFRPSKSFDETKVYLFSDEMMAVRDALAQPGSKFPFTIDDNGLVRFKGRFAKRKFAEVAQTQYYPEATPSEVYENWDELASKITEYYNVIINFCNEVKAILKQNKKLGL